MIQRKNERQEEALKKYLTKAIRYPTHVRVGLRKDDIYAKRAGKD